MLALGFPFGLYEKIFVNPGALEKARAQQEPLHYSTLHYVECKIARTLGMTVADYRKLPRRERRTQYFFEILANEKETYAYDQAKEKASLDRERQKPSTPLRHR